MNLGVRTAGVFELIENLLYDNFNHIISLSRTLSILCVWGLWDVPARDV